jgi:hypothetical protein
MKAIETTGKIDQKGLLQLDQPLKARSKKVRVIILFAEIDSPEDDKIWLSAMSNNPAFNFLKEPEEDVYTLNDGKPFTD